MSLRDFGQVPYLPILSLRPAEMRALEELPNRTKDLLLPVVHMRPWVGAHNLENAVQRLADAYGNRPIVVAMGERELSNERPVHAQLSRLRVEDDGFRNWCDFIEENENYIPAIQYGSLIEEVAQIECLHQLGRGLFVIVDQVAFPALTQISQRVGQITNGGNAVCFVLDFGHASRDHLQVAQRSVAFINTIREHSAYAYVSLSASSFPDTFVDLAEQPIYERRLFDEVLNQPGMGDIIYSDRGSARVERITGGGGQPKPRIDYPLRRDWNFYRSDDLVGFQGYQQQARRLMQQPDIWDTNLRVWGTQMIERTAVGDASAISGAQKATAARINLHLQRQAFYNDPNEAADTDEDWDG